MASSGRGQRGAYVSGSRIHQGLVGARELVGTPYLADPELRAEYARDIAPRTTIALTKILGEIYPDRSAPGRPGRMVDLGAGTGAVGAALRKYFGEEVDLIEVDRVTAGAVRAADITDVASLCNLAAMRTRFDLVVSAHVLNELYVDKTTSERLSLLANLVKRWCELLLAEGGTLILVEPALRETSRTLLGVRDHLLAAGLQIVAPCFFTGPCPALLRERDWCHDTAPIEPARRVDFSYLVVRPSGEPTHDPALFRIVSDPLPEKGRLKLFACGSSGRHAFVRLERHSSPSNADFDRLARGDSSRIVRTTFAQDGLRIVKDTTVTRIEPSP